MSADIYTTCSLSCDTLNASSEPQLLYMLIEGEVHMRVEELAALPLLGIGSDWNEDLLEALTMREASHAAGGRTWAIGLALSRWREDTGA